MVEAPGTTAALTERATELDDDFATEARVEQESLSLHHKAATHSASNARVAVLVVSYNGREDLCKCLDSLLADTGESDQVHFVVWDNNSSDETPEVVAAQFPSITLLRSDENLGYAGGGSAGWRWIQQNCPNADYVCVLNQDIVVAPNWLDALIVYLDQTPDVGLAQPMICLEPERHLINNLGLRCHYLGFSYQLNYRDCADSIPSTPREVDAISGAAFIVRTSFLAQHGLFSGDLFMYLEDVELSWRVRTSGLKCACVPKSIVFHKYSPDAVRENYRQLERNRYFLVLTYYPCTALLALGPPLVLMEIAQTAWAISNRLLFQRIGVWQDVLSSIASRRIVSRRRTIQSNSLGLHPDLLCLFSGRLNSSYLKGSWFIRAGDTFFAQLWQLNRVLFHWIFKGCQ